MLRELLQFLSYTQRVLPLSRSGIGVTQPRDEKWMSTRELDAPLSLDYGILVCTAALVQVSQHPSQRGEMRIELENLATVFDSPFPLPFKPKNADIGGVDVD